MSGCVVVSSRPWTRAAFEARALPGRWTYLSERDELTEARLADLAPRFVFFLHWSWRVPDPVVERFECVVFHMTDVPYGRGGSPLQNLIARGHRDTVMSALRMTPEVDAGPVYLKRPMSLEGSTAEEIYMRATELCLDMMEDIVRDEPEPEPQEGDVTRFDRRRPAESALPEVRDLGALHDFIRMLDAEGYPRAFLDHGPLRLEFGRSGLYRDRVEATVTIRVREDAGAEGGS